MKIIVRTFVVALALTGAIATTATPSNAKTIATAAKTSAMPAPRCPLSSPDGCGMNNW